MDLGPIGLTLVISRVNIAISGATYKHCVVEFMQLRTLGCIHVNRKKITSGYTVLCLFTNLQDISNWNVESGDFVL